MLRGSSRDFRDRSGAGGSGLPVLLSAAHRQPRAEGSARRKEGTRWRRKGGGNKTARNHGTTVPANSSHGERNGPGTPLPNARSPPDAFFIFFRLLFPLAESRRLRFTHRPDKFALLAST